MNFTPTKVVRYLWIEKKIGISEDSIHIGKSPMISLGKKGMLPNNSFEKRHGYEFQPECLVSYVFPTLLPKVYS